MVILMREGILSTFHPESPDLSILVIKGYDVIGLCVRYFNMPAL